MYGTSLTMQLDSKVVLSCEAMSCHDRVMQIHNEPLKVVILVDCVSMSVIHTYISAHAHSLTATRYQHMGP